MPSKKRKYNARFPAGRIKKIMQTDEEVGKVAQAVPIIISRTLELFVESLLSKALQVTVARNAKTLSPSHVKQCILAEARFDFLRDLVKNIPDVSAAEEKELMSAESSPNSSRFTDAAAPPRRIAREDSNSSSSCEIIRVPQMPANICSNREQLKRALSAETDTSNKSIKFDPGIPGTSHKIEPCTSAIPHVLPQIVTQHEIMSPIIQPGTSTETAIDLSKKEPRPVRTANFYQETFLETTHNSVIKVNPIYTTSQPSTSYTNLSHVEPVRKIEIVPSPTFERHNSLPRTPSTPYAPVINIDFSKNIAKPEIKVLDGVVTPTNVTLHKTATPSNAHKSLTLSNINKPKQVSRQNSKSKIEVKKVETKPSPQPIPVDIDKLNSGDLQIDEDYDT